MQTIFWSEIFKEFGLFFYAIITGIVASFFFWFMLSRATPKLIISPIIAKEICADGIQRFRIKVINMTNVDLVNLRAEFHLRWEIHPGVYRIEKASLRSDSLLVLRKVQFANGEPLGSHRFVVYDLHKRLNELPDDVFIRFRVIATNSISGVQKVFEKFYKISDITNGIFKSGDTFNITHSSKGLSNNMPNYTDSCKIEEALSLVRDSKKILLLFGDSRSGVKTGEALLRYCTDKEFCLTGEANGLNYKFDTNYYPNVIDAIEFFKPELAIVGCTAKSTHWPSGLVQNIIKVINARIPVISGLHPGSEPDQTLNIRCSPSWVEKIQPPPLIKKPKIRILTIGSDTNIGKFTTAYEIYLEIAKFTSSAKFVATGQTGMLVSGSGICIDAIKYDFSVSALRKTIIDLTLDNQIVVVEGQGSILHPNSLGPWVTTRAASPTHLIFVHKIGHMNIRDYPEVQIPKISEVIDIMVRFSRIGGGIDTCALAGISLDTSELSATEAEDVLKKWEMEYNIPVFDPIRFGASQFVKNLLISEFTP